MLGLPRDIWLSQILPNLSWEDTARLSSTNREFHREIGPLANSLKTAKRSVDLIYEKISQSRMLQMEPFATGQRKVVFMQTEVTETYGGSMVSVKPGINDDEIKENVRSRIIAYVKEITKHYSYPASFRLKVIFSVCMVEVPCVRMAVLL